MKATGANDHHYYMCTRYSATVEAHRFIFEGLENIVISLPNPGHVDNWPNQVANERAVFRLLRRLLYDD